MNISGIVHVDYGTLGRRGGRDAEVFGERRAPSVISPSGY